MLPRCLFCFSRELTREVVLPRSQDQSREGASHPLILPHYHHCLLQGEHPRDLSSPRTDRTTSVAVTIRELGSATCVCTYSLFYEACLPPEIVIMCNSKRQKCSIPTHHHGRTANETPWCRYRRNVQTPIASNTETHLLIVRLLLTTLPHTKHHPREHTHQRLTTAGNASESRNF